MSAKTFNKTLRDSFDLFSKLPSSKFKASVAISALRENMNKAMAAQETYVIDVVGPYIWACRLDIVAGESKRILAIDHAPYMVPLAKKYDFSIKDAAMCIGFMKDAYASASAEQRKPIIELVQQLLGAYATYRRDSTDEKKV